LVNQAQQALKLLLEAVNQHGSSFFLLHFDETQCWASKHFNRQNDHHVPPSDFSMYYLTALSDALLAFKGTRIRFAFTCGCVTR
jgi:hypothetical protein